MKKIFEKETEREMIWLGITIVAFIMFLIVLVWAKFS